MWKNEEPHNDRGILKETIPEFQVGCALLGKTALTFAQVDEVKRSRASLTTKEKHTHAFHEKKREVSAQMEEWVGVKERTICAESHGMVHEDVAPELWKSCAQVHCGSADS